MSVCAVSLFRKRASRAGHPRVLERACMRDVCAVCSSRSSCTVHAVAARAPIKRSFRILALVLPTKNYKAVARVSRNSIRNLGAGLGAGCDRISLEIWGRRGVPFDFEKMRLSFCMRRCRNRSSESLQNASTRQYCGERTVIVACAWSSIRIGPL